MNNQMTLQIQSANKQNGAYQTLLSNPSNQLGQQYIMVILLIQQFYIYGIGWVWYIFPVRGLEITFYVSIPILIGIQAYFSNQTDSNNFIVDIIALIIFNALIGIFYAILVYYMLYIEQNSFKMYEADQAVVYLLYPIFLFLLIIITLIVLDQNQICSTTTMKILLCIPQVFTLVLNIAFFGSDFLSIVFMQWFIIIIFLMAKYIKPQIDNAFVSASYLNGYALQLFVYPIQMMIEQNQIQHKMISTLDDNCQKSYKLKAAVAFSAYTMFTCVCIRYYFQGLVHIQPSWLIFIFTALWLILYFIILFLQKNNSSYIVKNYFTIIFVITFGFTMAMMQQSYDYAIISKDALLTLFFMMLLGLSIGNVGYCLMDNSAQRNRLIYLLAIPCGIWINSVIYFSSFHPLSILWTALELFLIILWALTIEYEENNQLTSQTIIMKDSDYMTGGLMLFQPLQTLIVRCLF